MNANLENPHEDTLLSVRLTTILPHEELNILEGRGLCHLPMDTSATAKRLGTDINLEVPNLAEEVVLIREPVVAPVSIGIGIDDGHADKVGSSLQRRDVVEISDHVGVVVLDDWAGDEIRARGEVDEGGCSGRAITSLSTATSSRSDGGVDGSRVVSNTIASCAIVQDVTEDGIVRVAIEGRFSSALNIGKPPVRCRLCHFKGFIRCGRSRVRAGGGLETESAQGQQGRVEEARQPHGCGGMGNGYGTGDDLVLLMMM